MAEKLIGVNWEQPLLQDYCQHLLSAVSLCSQVVKIPKDGDFSASLGTCSHAAFLIKLILMSDLNFPSHIM